MQPFRSGSVNMDSLRLPPPPPPPPLLLPPPPPPLHPANRRNTSQELKSSNSSYIKSSVRCQIPRSARPPVAGTTTVSKPTNVTRTEIHFQPPPPPTAMQRAVSHISPTKEDIKKSSYDSVIQPEADSNNDIAAGGNSPKQSENVNSPPLAAGDCQEKNPRKRPLGKYSPATTASVAGLPKELTQKFGPLKCDLCSVSVNSTIQAKMHYSGKQHEKKVNSFLLNWSSETGEPLPKMLKDSPSTKKSAVGEIRFCDVCNLVLTSAAHAEQHYMGRNHRRALAGRAVAISNAEKTKKDADDPSGRFGIGAKFQPWTNNDPLNLLSENSESSGFLKAKNLFCELCKVTATSQEQLDTHFRGAKHRKAEAALMNKPTISPVSVSSKQSDSILASVIRNDDSVQKPVGKDYSIYRTPSGYYYCQPCNLTLNSEAQFIQHCDSKKHKFKLATSKKPVSKPVKAVMP